MAPRATFIRTYLEQNPRALEQLRLTGRSFTVRFLARGVYNAVYLIASSEIEAVARLRLAAPHGNSLACQARKEVAVHRALHERQVAPALLYADESVPLLFLERCRGRGLAYTPRDLAAAARTYSRLHRQEPPSELPGQPDLHRESTGYLEGYLAWRGADPQVARLLEHACAQRRGPFPPGGSIVHGDASWPNWKLSGDHALLLDWDWAALGHPALDPAHLFSPLTARRKGHTLEDWEEEHFWKHYDGEPIQEAYRELLPLVVLRSVTWIAARVAELSRRHEQPSGCLWAQLEPGFLKALVRSGKL